MARIRTRETTGTTMISAAPRAANPIATVAAGRPAAVKNTEVGHQEYTSRKSPANLFYKKKMLKSIEKILKLL
jgi:hypothetical protein